MKNHLRDKISANFPKNGHQFTLLLALLYQTLSMQRQNKVSILFTLPFTNSIRRYLNTQPKFGQQLCSSNDFRCLN